MLRNTAASYGLITRVLHWLLAVGMFGLIGLGWYLVKAGYYDALYKSLLSWHQSVGVLLWLFALLLLAWHRLSKRPVPVEGLHAFERVASSVSKVLLYLSMLSIPLSGYLMSVAEDGQVLLFDRVPLPGLPAQLHAYAEEALTFHIYASYAILGIGLVHGLGALKHHFVDRNEVLMRMLRGS